MASEERKQILEMLSSGKISVEEAARLLEAVESPAANAAEAPGGPVTLGKGRTLRVRVVEHGRQKVNITVPLGLAKFFLGLAAKHGLKDEKLKDLDVNEIMRQVETGLTGKIVEVNDEAEGQLVEVYVD